MPTHAHARLHTRTHNYKQALSLTRASQLENEVEAHAAQLLQLKLELARRDQKASQHTATIDDAERGGGVDRQLARETPEKWEGGRERSSPERRELESRVEELTLALKERDDHMIKVCA